MTALVTFITRCRHVYNDIIHHDYSGQYRVVIGNESCDLDSASSSLLAAYLFSCEYPDVLHIPFMNIQRHLLQLRPDVTYMISTVLALSPDVLLFESELMTMLQTTDCDIILVDHNTLAVKQQQYSHRVCGVLDHHADTGQYRRDVNVVCPLASCMSCILLYFRAFPLPDNMLDIINSYPHGTKERSASAALRMPHSAVPLHHTFVKFVLMPIMLDSGNGSQKHVAYTYIDRVLLDHYAPDRNALYEELMTIRHDVSTLSAYDLCNRDYKTWRWRGGAIGCASVPMNVGSWMSRVHMHSNCDTAAVYDDVHSMLDYIIQRDNLLMFISLHNNSTGADPCLSSTVRDAPRQILLYSPTDDMHGVSDLIVSRLSPIGIEGLGRSRVYGVDGSVSRKVLAAALNV